MIVVGTEKDFMESEWVRAEWETFIGEIRGGRKAGRIFTYTEGMQVTDLPLPLRKFQMIVHSATAIQTLLGFIQSSDTSDETNIESSLVPDKYFKEIGFKDNYWDDTRTGFIYSVFMVLETTVNLKLKALLIICSYGLIAAISVISLERYGYLESFELQYYDRLVRSQNPQNNSEIVFCKITEKDYRNYDLDHMRDDLLAQIISKLQQSSPKIIGIDYIKDRKVGEGSEQLKEVFDKGNVVGVMRLGNEIGSEPVAYYPYVLDCSQVPTQTGFADLELDDVKEEVVRRVALTSMIKLPECSSQSRSRGLRASHDFFFRFNVGS